MAIVKLIERNTWVGARSDGALKTLLLKTAAT
jgi:hypothetical protein